MRNKEAIQPSLPSDLSAVIFDLDGTLCDYNMSVAEAMTAALSLVHRSDDLIGDPEQAASRYYALWFEMEADHASTESLRDRIWVRLLSENGVDDRTLAQSLSRIYADLRANSLSLVDGARPLLADLGKRYTLGLLTNGPSDLQWQKIDALGIRSSFGHILVSGDSGVHKPDRRVFATMLRYVRVAPEKAVYVGNSYQTDIIGAHDAGMWSVWVTADGEKDPEATAADMMIAQLSELRRILL
jgi:putative hydrolase of the HAD superfamily